MQVKVCSFVPGQNLQPLTDLIRREQIAFAVTEDDLGVHLFVDDSDLNRVSELLNRVIPPAPPSTGENAVWLAIKRSPMTFVFVILGLLGLVIHLVDRQLIIVPWLTFTQFNVLGGHLVPADLNQTYLQHHQWWRLLTPTFLHFSFAHILFNGLAMWEVGRRLEFCLQPNWYLFLFVTISVFANGAQFWSFGPSIFGGLSGVLYGFFGMQLVLYYRTKLRFLAMPKATYIVLGVSLMLGPLGIMEALFGVNIADGAHFGGLLCGVIMAAIMPLSAMKVAPKEVQI